MLTKVETAADLKLLPFYIREALKPVPIRTHRHLNQIERAARKAAIQTAVVRAIKDGEISIDLGVEILSVNNAFGRKGQAAILSISGA